jgi:hypothetical protein
MALSTRRRLPAEAEGRSSGLFEHFMITLIFRWESPWAGRGHEGLLLPLATSPACGEGRGNARDNRGRGAWSERFNPVAN